MIPILQLEKLNSDKISNLFRLAEVCTANKYVSRDVNPNWL